MDKRKFSVVTGTQCGICEACGQSCPQEDVYCTSCGCELRHHENPTNALFTAEWRQKVKENTVQFWKALRFPTFEQMNNPTLQGNAIKERVIVIQGAKDSGKNTKAHTIVHGIINGLQDERGEWIVPKYGAENVHIQEMPQSWASGEALHAARWFEKLVSMPHWTPKPIQVIILHDVTSVKFNEEHLAAFWQLRHLMQSKTGLQRGLIVVIFTEHSFYDFQKQFRISFQAVLISDMPMNDYDRRNYRHQFTIAREDEDDLDAIEQDRVSEPKLCGYSFAVVRPRTRGIIYLPQIVEQQRRRFKVPVLSRTNIRGSWSLTPYLILGGCGIIAAYFVQQSQLLPAAFWSTLTAILGLAYWYGRRRRTT